MWYESRFSPFAPHSSLHPPPIGHHVSIFHDDLYACFFAPFDGRFSIYTLFVFIPASRSTRCFVRGGFLILQKGGVHAVGHALLAVVPLFLLCDAEDVDCEHARPHHDRPQPQRILVYDKRPGGVGVSDAMFGCHRCVCSV